MVFLFMHNLFYVNKQFEYYEILAKIDFEEKKNFEFNKEVDHQFKSDFN